MSSPAPARPTPTAGMLLLGCIAALAALILITASVVLPSGGWNSLGPGERLVPAVLGCLCAVAAEALCFARPWAARACTALFAVVLLPMAVLAVANEGIASAWTLVALLLLVVCVLLPLLRYV